MNAYPALPLFVIGLFAAAMLIVGFILSRKKDREKRDGNAFGYVVFAILVAIIVAMVRFGPSTSDTKEPNKSPEPTPTAVTPRAIETKSK